MEWYKTQYNQLNQQAAALDQRSKLIDQREQALYEREKKIFAWMDDLAQREQILGNMVKERFGRRPPYNGPPRDRQDNRGDNRGAGGYRGNQGGYQGGYQDNRQPRGGYAQSTSGYAQNANGYSQNPNHQQPLYNNSRPPAAYQEYNPDNPQYGAKAAAPPGSPGYKPAPSSPMYSSKSPTYNPQSPSYEPESVYGGGAKSGTTL